MTVILLPVQNYRVVIVRVIPTKKQSLILKMQSYFIHQKLNTMLKQTYNQQIDMLQEEIKMLRSFVISAIGKDKEGGYRPEFVKKILKAAKSKPKYTYKDSKTFLSQIGIEK
jgi:hypothetical protein